LHYRNLVAGLDRIMDRIRRRYAGHIACRRGCHCGCRNLSIFPIEALSLADAMQNLSTETAAKIRKRASAVSLWNCPLLEDRACRLYPFRPIICRTHGFPLKTIYKGRSSIGYCRENFKEMPTIPEDAIIDLDTVNRMLREVNAAVVGKMADGLQMPARLSISEAVQLEP
jgi:uncharacterized protein